MVIAYHVIFGAYGFWLPNDPRGSWSTEVWARHLQPFGGATKVDTRQSLAGREHNRSLRLEAKQHLQYPAVQLNPAQIHAIGNAFTQAIEDLGLDLHACSIMPDHVHFVMGRYRSTAEFVAGFLKRAATRRLSDEGIHPLQELPPSQWSSTEPLGGRRMVCLFELAGRSVQGGIRYAEENPVKAGLPPQRWPFVRPYM